jgi:hypothetical protein
MLVVNGFLENGVFTPEVTLFNIKGRQKAILNIEEPADEKIKQERVEAWREFSRAIKVSNEELEGEPERINFKIPEEIESYEIRA